jgi:formate--tetrahydrofolate ligase
VRTIAKEIYRADDISVDKAVAARFAEIEKLGFGHYPICMAKTQYSFSTDPSLKCAPDGFIVPVREVRLSSGAEFVVVLTGDIMTMPGLPSVPAAEAVGVGEDGLIFGLF